MTGVTQRVKSVLAACVPPILPTLLFFCLFCVKNVSASEQGWILTQKSKVLGDQYIYVSQDGLKCINPRAGFAFVTSSPDWSVVLYNDQTKVYYKTSVEQWKQELEAHGLHNADFDGIAWAKGRKGSISGVKATQFVMTQGPSAIKVIKGKRVRMRGKIKDAEYWVADNIKVPPQLARFFSATYGIPTTVNVGLRLNYTDRDGTKALLDTYRAQQTPIPATYFNYPAQYKLVATSAEVMITADQKQMVEDIAQQLGGAGPTSIAPTAANNPAANTGGSASPDNVSLPGGLTVSRETVNRFLDALNKKSNK